MNKSANSSRGTQKARGNWFSLWGIRMGVVYAPQGEYWHHQTIIEMQTDKHRTRRTYVGPIHIQEATRFVFLLWDTQTWALGLSYLIHCKGEVWKWKFPLWKLAKSEAKSQWQWRASKAKPEDVDDKVQQSRIHTWYFISISHIVGPSEHKYQVVRS